jgi:hypothetical protein
MAFSQHKTEERTGQFDLMDSNDKRVILEFEKELAPYEERQVVVLKGFGKFEKPISGFELYLHENGIYRYSTAYPYGAFVVDRLAEYRFLKLKKQALDRLRDSRRKAADHEEARIVEAILWKKKNLRIITSQKIVCRRIRQKLPEDWKRSK